jgi:hypothetical protein
LYHRYSLGLSHLYLILLASEEASAEKIECGYIFSSVKNVKIESCDKDKIEVIGVSHGKKLRLEGSESPRIS